jgi:hypothetical protein
MSRPYSRACRSHRSTCHRVRRANCARKRSIRFLDEFKDFLRRVRRRPREYIICGDWNIAHKEIDLKNWRANQKNSGFLPEERAWMDELFGPGASSTPFASWIRGRTATPGGPTEAGPGRTTSGGGSTTRSSRRGCGSHPERGHLHRAALLRSRAADPRLRLANVIEALRRLLRALPRPAHGDAAGARLLERPAGAAGVHEPVHLAARRRVSRAPTSACSRSPPRRTPSTFSGRRWWTACACRTSARASGAAAAGRCSRSCWLIVAIMVLSRAQPSPTCSPSRRRCCS